MNELLQPLYDLYVALFGELPGPVAPYFKPVVFILLAVLAGFLVRRFFVSRLKTLASQTANIYDDIVVDVLRRKTILWVGLIAAIIAVPSLPWRPADLRWVEQVLMAIFVLSITLAIVRSFTQIVNRYAEQSGTGVGGSTLIRYVGSVILYIVGGIIILSLFDISVLPAITALGVGGLAVALAFQDTLANIFAGIHITLSRQLRMGDYVELAGQNQQGYVADIGWRTTTIRTLSNNLVIVPNKKMAESILLNYNLPESTLSVEISVGVDYDVDPARVEQVLIDEVRSAYGQVQGLLDLDPAVRFVAFGDSALLINVYPLIDSIENKLPARHELMKRIYQRFRRENISIPFPIRRVFIKGEGEEKKEEGRRVIGTVIGGEGEGSKGDGGGERTSEKP